MKGHRAVDSVRRIVDEPSYSGARAPERRASVESVGLRINVVEWGDAGAPPLVLCHGMFDHAMGFAVLGPLLAERYRVIAIDARGHGDSDWADAYTWPLDIVDIVNVLRWIGRPSFLVGHSKGGGQSIDAAVAAPELVKKLVNIDGFGPPPFKESELPSPGGLTAFLDERRAAAERSAWRPYASFDDLVKRRGQQNPRLPADWLRYFVFHASRRSEDGWRWKSDPHMASHGFGPWTPDWVGPAYAALRVPLLAITGSERDTWGPLPEKLLAPRLAFAPELHRTAIAGAGHFVHMEKPVETARAILDFCAA